MYLKNIFLEAENIPKYKLVINYKDEEIEAFLTRDELLNGFLKFTSPEKTISYLVNFVKTRFKVKNINFKSFFNDLKSLNIINEKTQSSFQLNKIENLTTGDKTDYQLIVGQKKGLEGASLDDITDKLNKDKTKNGILDNRLQNAINAFRTIVQQDAE